MYGIDQTRASGIMQGVSRKTFDKQSVIFLYCMSVQLACYDSLPHRRR